MKRAIIIGLVILAVGFAFGRYSAPEKIKIEKETVIVEKTTKETKENAKTHTGRDKKYRKIIVELVHPDGTKETRTEIVEDTTTNRVTEKRTDSREENDSTTTSKETKTIETGRSKLIVSAMAGPSLSLSSGLSLGPISYGAHIQRNFLGPIMIGAWGLSSGTGGFSLGLMF